MKRNILTILLITIAIMSMNARTFVLATGVSNYGDDQINLSQTTKDAKRFKEVMETQTHDITLLTSSNVTHDNVLEKLRAICNRAQKEDRVIFFYSGHGMPGAICAYDQAILYDELINVLSNSTASEKICFIDACHAGTMANKETDYSWTKSIKDKSRQIFFVSCRSDEYSTESSILGAGYFTQALLKGLRGKADTDDNKQITVIELFKYIYGDVLKHSQEKQHPQLIAPKSLYNVVISKW
jgi:uncharacterized caspase-like protein